MFFINTDLTLLDLDLDPNPNLTLILTVISFMIHVFREWRRKVYKVDTAFQSHTIIVSMGSTLFLTSKKFMKSIRRGSTFKDIQLKAKSWIFINSKFEKHLWTLWNVKSSEPLVFYNLIDCDHPTLYQKGEEKWSPHLHVLHFVAQFPILALYMTVSIIVVCFSLKC